MTKQIHVSFILQGFKQAINSILCSQSSTVADFLELVSKRKRYPGQTLYLSDCSKLDERELICNYVPKYIFIVTSNGELPNEESKQRVRTYYQNCESHTARISNNSKPISSSKQVHNSNRLPLDTNIDNLNSNITEEEITEEEDRR